MKTKRLLLIALPLVVMAVTACNPLVKGSGNLVTETRQVSNFDRITLDGSGEMFVTQAGSESLRIETDDNVMQYVKAEVEGGTLKLGFKEGVNLVSPSRLVFNIIVDDLDGVEISGSGDFESGSLETGRLDLEISGSGNIHIDDLAAGEVKARISGSGEIDLVGDTDYQDIAISGSGKYLAGDLCSASVRVSTSGSGDATVCASETLDVTISGSGSVSYYGRPTINSSGSGSGGLTNLGDK